MGSGRRHERRLLIALVGLAAAGTASGVLATFKVSNPWAIGGAAVAVAVVMLLSGLIQERYKRSVTRRDEIALKLQDGALVLPSGRLPKVCDRNDPIRLGVHPAIRLPGSPDAEPPVYVPRDIDADLRERLAVGGFLLLVGDSSAGKSRTAYEAMRAMLPDHILVAPHDRGALPAAIDSCLQLKRAVLWLSEGVARADVSLAAWIGQGMLARSIVVELRTRLGEQAGFGLDDDALAYQAFELGASLLGVLREDG
ncbi:hypothetical protein [Nonomuraea typhae]|uniref:ATP-binding protein n=1 Tax=Nonomuraea typhae TaxID=2603600 RepID=A0ABW7ZC98_9ACTN